MSSSGTKILIGVFVGVVFACGLFTAGVITGTAVPMLFDLQYGNYEAPVGTLTSSDTDDINQLFKPFWQTWDIVHNQFVDQPIDDEKMLQGAIQGMLDSLGDPNTSYMDPDQYRQANLGIEGEYEGIGAYIDVSTEFVTIISVVPGSPAEEAGILPGDQVIAVDGEDMSGADGDYVVSQILGPAGTVVNLTIQRGDETDPLEFVMERAKITIPSVEGEILEDGIAYIRIYDFGSRTTEDFHGLLQKLITGETRGLILDLRGNPGGLLDSAVEVASELLPEGIVLSERFSDGQEQVYEVEPGGLATEIPLVVLINGGSASASEIVAAAIQDTNRGLLVGETSFGKGTVQSWIALTNNAGAIRVTVARWYTPNDRQITEVGLTPDIEVPLGDEGLQADSDPQLDKAMEILTQLNYE
jgi:carboxyl-terminal processing protease